MHEANMSSGGPDGVALRKELKLPSNAGTDSIYMYTPLKYKGKFIEAYAEKTDLNEPKESKMDTVYNNKSSDKILVHLAKTRNAKGTRRH